MRSRAWERTRPECVGSASRTRPGRRAHGSRPRSGGIPGLRHDGAADPKACAATPEPPRPTGFGAAGGEDGSGGQATTALPKALLVSRDMADPTVVGRTASYQDVESYLTFTVQMHASLTVLTSTRAADAKGPEWVMTTETTPPALCVAARIGTGSDRHEILEAAPGCSPSTGSSAAHCARSPTRSSPRRVAAPLQLEGGAAHRGLATSDARNGVEIFGDHEGLAYFDRRAPWCDGTSRTGDWSSSC